MIRSLQRTLDIPVFETERLRLRGHTVDDFQNCAALWGDVNVTRYIAGSQRLEATEMACLIHPDNLASIRVAKKCGFRERLHTMYKGSPTIIFGWKKLG
jgi:RimJ/RimL family protein N-acetyltransferase